MPPPLQDYVKRGLGGDDSDEVDIEFSSDEDNEGEADSPDTRQKHIRRIVSDYKSVYHVEKLNKEKIAKAKQQKVA